MDSALNFLQVIQGKSFQLRMNKSGYWEFRYIGNDTQSKYSRYRKWKLVHRVVAELKTGLIPRGYEVHHIDHDKTNNHPSNLQVLTVAEHRAIHRRRKQFKRLRKKLYRKPSSKKRLNKKEIEKTFNNTKLPVIYNNPFYLTSDTIMLRLNESIRIINSYTALSRYNNNGNYLGGTCYRCGGTGYLSEYWYYADGVCFSCGGSGTQ
tara:strand:+ start:177 stop:794 length:618 start_codon:yes stop_codon:yes gene_type:complete